jgi:FkbM family methyltransferase
MVRHDFKLCPLGFKFSGNGLMQVGSFEPEETAIIKEKLQQVDVFIDVGANIGYYVCLSRSMNKRTVAIEPLYENLNYLYRNIASNSWSDVEVIPVGMSDQVGAAFLYGASTGASLVPNWAGASESLKQAIPLNTMDNFLAERFKESKLLIKVDVEGAEYETLLGAKELLARSVPATWLIEICFSENYNDGINPNFNKIFNLFWAQGFTAYSVNGGVKIVQPEDVLRWLRNGQRDFGYVSYLFEKQ